MISVNLNLGKRSVVVTGASRGIGAAICEVFAQEGANVFAVARGELDLNKMCVELSQLGVRVTPVPGDVSTAQGCEDIRREVLQFSDSIDVVVHNAGGAEVRGELESLSDSDWRRTYEVNVMSAFWIAQAFWPDLKLSNQPRIAFVSSTTAQEPGYYDPHYSAAKAALLNFSKHLSTRMGPDSILVNTLIPGPIRTLGLDSNIAKVNETDETDEIMVLKELANLASSIPLGMLGSPVDVANATVFLCSGANNWITGATLRIDGGKSRSV
jgi:3-oxoacyl-[acyl-carrier protein] reductase